jgi:hypothetical protein
MNKTTTRMEDITRLTQIKNELTSQSPDLDQLMPKFEETNEIEKRLTEFFTHTKNLIIEKRKGKESS